jgi:transcriptional/translational regulatory protein YebC/TACO1
MEAAVARGQGISTTGAALENLTLEAIMPPSIALVVEVETDNRKRTLADLRFLVKSTGGTVTPTSYLFTKRGVVVFEKDERGLGVDEVLDDAIEAGAEDVETDDDGNIIVWTDPSGTTGAAEALKKSHDLKVKSSEIIWAPNEDTLAPFDSQEAYQALVSLVDALQDNPNVQGVYANVAQGVIEEGAWVELQGKIDV